MSGRADPRTAYLALARSHPELFRNFTAARSYEILLDPRDVERARRRAAEARSAAGLPADDVRVGLLARDPYLTLLRDAVRFPDGELGLYNRTLVPVGATVLPLLHGRILLLHRFRHGTRSWHLEAPRGMATSAEAPEADARRELHEEMGALAAEMRYLGRLHPSTGCCDELQHLFFARLESVGAPDPHEAISEIRAFTPDEFRRKVIDGEITDGPTLGVFLKAQLSGLIPL